MDEKQKEREREREPKNRNPKKQRLALNVCNVALGSTQGPWSQGVAALKLMPYLPFVASEVLPCKKNARLWIYGNLVSCHVVTFHAAATHVMLVGWLVVLMDRLH